jgi:hypothetical protein
MRRPLDALVRYVADLTDANYIHKDDGQFLARNEPPLRIVVWGYLAIPEFWANL